jgi:hypothetical protein
MSGYRAGVIQADKDVQLFNANKLSGIDAHQDKIKCPADYIIAVAGHDRTLLPVSFDNWPFSNASMSCCPRIAPARYPL